MQVVSSETAQIRSTDDVVRIRQRIRLLAISVEFNLVEQTKIVTASSELARNTLIHGGGGKVAVEVVHNGTKKGIRLVFEDTGPGIADVELAMRDGYSSGGGLGHGLGGAKRLTHEFALTSTPGEGTRIEVVRWKGL